MKSTVFNKYHLELGARMVSFAGYDMPVEYSGINDEHIAVRKRAGLFDVSHMGEFFVLGPKALKFIQYITSNDVSTLHDGKVQYSCFPNRRGGIVDDLLVYRYNEEKYLLVVNAANIQKDWDWCSKFAIDFGLIPGEDLINESDNISQIAVQGPMAMKVVQKLTATPVETMYNFTFREIEIAGISNVMLSITGYTGAGGCEIYVDNENGPKLWQAVIEAGKEYGIIPAGLGARDTLRIEAGFCLYGNDIDDNTSPLEAGLGWITKFSDSKDFVGKELLLKQKENGVSRRLRGFVMIDRGIPRQHYEVVDSAGEKIGEVTSGTMSPILGHGIGMAYLSSGYWKYSTEIFIRVRNKDLRAKVVKLPFI